MKFTIQRESLLKLLQFAASIANKQSTLPILGNLLLQVLEDQLIVVGSDAEIELKGIVSLTDTPSQTGSITVSARKLLEVCRSLPDCAQVELELISLQPKTDEENKNQGSKKGEQLQIRSGRSRFLLATLPSDQFPISSEAAPTGELVIVQNRLKALFMQTYFAMAQQDIRHYLNGILLEITPNKVNVVATDGHRLALSSFSTEGTQQAQVIIPRKAILELLKLLGDEALPVTLTLSETQLRVASKEFVLTTKIIDSKFPDYRRVIPQNSDKKIELDRDVLKQALMRVSILANEKNRAVRLGLSSDHFKITACNSEKEEAHEELEMVYEGQSIEMDFNANYLLDVLNTIPPGIVTLHLNDTATTVLLLTGVNVHTTAHYVVMPMRI